MGNSNSNFTSEGAELPPTNTWWGRGHRMSGWSYRKPSQPIRSQSRTTKQTNAALNTAFGTVFTNNIFENKWTNPLNGTGNNCGFISIKNGSLSSEENLETFENHLRNSWCQDSGFGESFQVPSPVSSQSPGSSPDLILAQDLTDLMRTGMKDVFRSRIRKWSDWTGSLRIKKRRVQDPDLSSIWSFNALQNPDLPQFQVQNLDQTKTFEDQRFSIYQNFKQDLESKSTLGSTKTSSDPDSVDLGDQQGLRSIPGLNQDPGVDRGVVRRAGWIWIKPLIELNKEQLELVPRRKWKRYWVKLRGCWLQFFKSPGVEQDPEQDLEQDLSPQTGLHEGDLGPVMEMRVWDSLVQPVPEHPTKEHVFCLSNATGQVYLLQACFQSDLEAWITSVHSVAAATACRRSGHHRDTVDFLRERVHFLSQKIEAEQRVKKTAALQLSIISETDKRRSIQAQVCSRDQAILRRHNRALIGQTRERWALIGRSIRRRRSFKSSTKTAGNQNSEVQTGTTPQVQEEQEEELMLLLSRSSSHLDYGFAVIGQVDAEGWSHIYISQVDPNGLSANQGLCMGLKRIQPRSNPVLCPSGLCMGLKRIYSIKIIFN